MLIDPHTLSTMAAIAALVAICVPLWLPGAAWLADAWRDRRKRAARQRLGARPLGAAGLVVALLAAVVAHALGLFGAERR